jgi:hypothetical protein
VSAGEVAIAPAAKLPVGRTLLGAYATLFRNFWPFAQIAAFPLALSVLLPYAWAEFYSPFFDWLVKLIGYRRALWINDLNPEWIAGRLIAWLVLVLFLSHWLQFLAAKEAAGKKPGGKPGIVRVFSRRDLRVLRYGVLMLVMLACSIFVRQLSMVLSVSFPEADHLRLLLSAIQSLFLPFTLVLVAIDGLVVGRSAPVFAAAAVGGTMTLRQAWQRTQAQTLRLMLLWAVLFWITYALAGPLQSAADDLYFVLIVNILPPVDYVGIYYRPPALQVVRLPSTAMHCAAMALGGCLFWRVYRGDAKARDDLLERFE